MKILIPAMERGGYADLTVLMSSLHQYYPQIPVIIAYKGSRPRLFGADLVKQPDDCQHFGDACRFLMQLKHTKADEALCFLNDDTVVMPNTFDLALDDLKVLAEQKQKVGMLGFRSNFVAGYQNIRVPQPGDTQLVRLRFPSESRILRVPQVFGIGFIVNRAVLQELPLDWTRLHWYSDDLLAFDLTNRGYGQYVSRAYVHHIGSRSGGEEKWEQWDQEAKQWILTNRPDFAAARGWSASPSTSPPIITASSSTDTDPTTR